MAIPTIASQFGRRAVNEQQTKNDRTAAFKLLVNSARPDLPQLKFASAWLIFAALIEALGPWFGKTLIDKVLLPKSNDVMLIVALLAGALVAGVVATWVRYFQLRRLAGLAMRSVQRLREQVYNHVLRLPMSYFDSAITGQMVSRVTNDTEAVKQLYIQVLFTILDAVIMISGMFTLMFWLNWRLALIAATLIPAVIVVVFLYQRASASAVARTRELRSEVNAQMSESISGMQVIQASNAVDEFSSRFVHTNWQQYNSKQLEVRANAWLLRPMLDAVRILLLAAILLAFGLDVASGVSNPGGPLSNQGLSVAEVGLLYAFIAYVGRVGDPLVDITVQFAQFQQSIVAAARVNTLLKESEVNLSLSPNKITRGKIEFKHLDFQYRVGPKVLKAINLTIPSGAFIGIVGHTGSGKSTLLSLLLRFYNAPKNTLLIDDLAIEQFGEQSYREQVGLVPQEPFLIAASVHENIAMGRALSKDQIIQAAQAAQAHEFVMALPQAYETVLGEGGARLSVGQKQLVAIARTLAGQPKILLLDEATSHIDSETEILVQQALDKLRGRMTVIAVAHRLSTIRDADQIVVMNHGALAEQGTHAQLMTKEKGIYARLYELQKIQAEQG
jgi:ATP-binding cassette, subfamily B, multidrug efflux pump